MLPRIAAVLVPDARLAVVDLTVGADAPWRPDESRLIVHYSVMQDFERYDLAELLAARGVWAVDQRTTFGPVPFRQRVEDYIEHFHSTSGLRRAAMTKSAVREFDEQLLALVEPHAIAGVLTLNVRATAVFGTPLSSAAGS